MDLLTVITAYLDTHKRLVVPQLGAFLVKEPRKSIVFSELLKRDDGVLHALLCADGCSEIEAAGKIDRFVFEVRQAVERGETYVLKGFGALKPGPNGTIVFAYGDAASRPEVSAQPLPAVQPDAPAAPAAPAKPAVPASSGLPGVAGPLPSGAPSHINTARMAETVRNAFKQESDRPDAEEESAPGTSEHAAAPQPAPRRKPAYTLEEAYAEPKPKTSRPRRKTDRFLLLAIFAALIAVAAIAFGFWREAQERQAEEEFLELQQPESSALLE